MPTPRKTAYLCALIVVAIIVGVLVFRLTWPDNDGEGAQGDHGETVQAPSPDVEAEDSAEIQTAKGTSAGTAAGSEDLTEGAEEILEAAEKKVTAKNDPRSHPVKSMLALRKKAAEKRKKVKLALTPYAEKKEELYKNIAAKWDLIPENVPAMIEAARKLNEEFWQAGDFDDVASFDHIYEARATLETCLALDPKSENALWAAIEVAEAGWPMILSGEEFKRYDSWTEFDNKADAINIASMNMTKALRWKLWSEHVREKKDLTVDDLALGMAVLRLGAPVRPLALRIKEENTDLSRDARYKVLTEALVEANLSTLDWAVNACKSNEKWHVYLELLESRREEVEAGTSGGPLVVIPPWDRLEFTRYWGRSQVFRGPVKRQVNLVYYHESVD